jgi:hypothetical protein
MILSGMLGKVEWKAFRRSTESRDHPPFTRPPDLPSLRRASQSSEHRPVTGAEALQPHSMARASKRRIPPALSGSRAWPWDGLVQRRRSEPSSRSRRPSGAGDGFDLVPRSPLNSVHIPAKAKSGRLSSRANQTTSFFPVAGLGAGAYSAKLLAGTRQRFSGLSQPHQWGDDVLRMLVTGKPPARAGEAACPIAWW